MNELTKISNQIHIQMLIEDRPQIDAFIAMAREVCLSVKNDLKKLCKDNQLHIKIRDCGGEYDKETGIVITEKNYRYYPEEKHGIIFESKVYVLDYDDDGLEELELYNDAIKEVLEYLKNKE